MRAALQLAAAASAVLVLSGCTYDYLQHTDRVSYAAGDAVSANLVQETTNPSKRSMYVKDGLGKNGIVTKQDGASGAPGSN